jgi:hypothetical protein
VSVVLVRTGNSSRAVWIQATVNMLDGNNIYAELKYVERKLLTKSGYFDIFHNPEYPYEMESLITIYLKECPILAITLCEKPFVPIGSRISEKQYQEQTNLEIKSGNYVPTYICSRFVGF